MKATLSKNEIQSVLARRFGSFSKLREKVPTDTLSIGIREVDVLSNGLPRGGITEIVGQSSSGRTSLLLAALAQATSREEICALIDASDRFDPLSGVDASTEFERLLWIRCGDDVERAFKATDLVLQSGGFSLVVLDMADVAAQFARKIVSSWWYRFRRAIENTPTALMVISQVPCVRSCASLSLELKNNRPVWSITKPPAFEANGMALKANESGDLEQLAKNQPRLFLVSDLAQQHMSYDSLLTHTLLLHGTNVQVAQQKPIASEELKFRTYGANAATREVAP